MKTITLTDEQIEALQHVVELCEIIARAAIDDAARARPTGLQQRIDTARGVLRALHAATGPADEPLTRELLERAGGVLKQGPFYLLADEVALPAESRERPGVYFDVAFGGELVEYRVGGECQMCGDLTTADGHGKYCDDCIEGEAR